MKKKDSYIYKKTKEIFEIYKNYKFKINNKVLYSNTCLKIENKNMKIITNYVELIDKVVKTLNNEEQKIIKLEFIDELNYSSYSLSQSTFFHKRKIACKKLYNILFCGSTAEEIEKAFNLWKLN